MRFRVLGRDAHSGNPVQPVEVMADCADSARDLAVRLGVQVESVEAIEATALDTLDGPGELSDWFGRSLQWRVDAPGLLKLGIQHPQWGRRIATTAMKPAMVVMDQARFGALVAASVAVLVAFGHPVDTILMSVAWFFLLVVFPLLGIKLVAYVWTRRVYAPEGFPAPRELQLDQDGLRLRSDTSERHWPFDAVRSAYELPDFLLLCLDKDVEIAVPVSVFDSRRQAMEFARHTTRLPGAHLHEDYRSESVGQRRPERSSAMTWFLAMACFSVLAVVMWLHFRSL